LRGLETFQGTHILGASRGHLSDSVIFLLDFGLFKVFIRSYRLLFFSWFLVCKELRAGTTLRPKNILYIILPVTYRPSFYSASA